MKNTLIFIDGKTLKIVFGSFLKCINLNDLSEDSSQAFIEKVFAESKVALLTSAAEVDLESFTEWIQQQSGKKITTEKTEKTETTETTPERKQPMLKQRAPNKDTGEGKGHVWIKSLAEGAIIVDDLETNEEIRNSNTKKALTIIPGLPVNLSILDPEKVRKSIILQKLVKDGVLVPVSHSEALQLKQDFDKKMAELAILKDQRKASPIVSGSVESFMRKVETEMFGNADDTESEIITSAPDYPRERGQIDPVPNFETMSELFEQIGESDPEITELQNESQILPRERGPVTSTASTIKRRHHE